MNCCRALCVCVCVCVFECACVQSLRGLPKYVIDPQDPLRPLIKWGRYWGDTRGPWKFLKFLRLTSPAHTHTHSLAHTHTHACTQGESVVCQSVVWFASVHVCLCGFVCVYMYPNNLSVCLAHPSATVTDGLTLVGPALQMDFSLCWSPEGEAVTGPGLLKRLRVWTDTLELWRVTARRINCRL